MGDMEEITNDQSPHLGGAMDDVEGGGAMGDNVKDLKKRLFKAVMKGEWETVVDIYTKHSSVQAAKITRSEDTVLHVAVSEGKRDTVLRLVKAVADKEARTIIGLKNENENTPLHLAAKLEMEEGCVAMAKKCPGLVVEARNKRGETPLFMAAKYGKKQAFFALQKCIAETAGDSDISFCRRKVDGNTILHQAITGEYFDLALEIITLYPRLVNLNNERGETPLQCLANRPSVFKSGSRYGLFDTLIYSCTFVDPLVVKYPKYKEAEDKNQLDDIKPKEGMGKFPKNYEACFHAFELLKLVGNIIVHSFQARSMKRCYIADEENPHDHKEHVKNSRSSSPPLVPPQELGAAEGATQPERANQEGDDMPNRHHNGSSGKQWFPQNYETCFDLFKLAIKVLLVILGIGLRRTQEIGKKKRKHVHACQIMDQLVSQSSMWEYDIDERKDGRKPEGKLMEEEFKLPNERPSTDDIEIPKDCPIRTIDNSMMEEQITTLLKEQQGASSIMVGSATEMLKKIPDNFPLAVQQDVSTAMLGMHKPSVSSKEPEGVTPILVAAMRGVTEMVETILNKFPVAIWDRDSNDKNIVLLAVEHRQPNVYQLLLKRNIMRESEFGRVDKDGNSALHLAATLGQNRPWSIPGAALQMQWEIKWYKFVQKSMATEFFPKYNQNGKTARDLFSEQHQKLVKDGGKWLSNTAQSCSVVAALIATVAFASATTVPGGINEASGFPVLEGKAAFQIFAISALVALCFSVTSLIMFLAILTSRYQVWDFENDLPAKLIIGLTSLFMSIAAMLVSFCAGHFFVVEKKLKYAAYPIYAVMGLPVSFFAVAQFPLYVDLIRATFRDVPERTEKMRGF